MRYNRLIIVLLGILASVAVGDDFSDGATALSHGNYNDAARRFEQWLKAHPHDCNAAALLGITRYHQGHRRAAISMLEQARNGGTRYGSRVLYYLGLAYSSIGESAKARDSFATLHHAHPNSPEASKVDRAVAAARIARDLSEPEEPVDNASAALSWFRFITLASGGYDSNPARQDHPQTSPAQEPRWFISNFASLRFDVPHTPVFIEGLFANRTYFGNDANNYRSMRGRLGADFDVTSSLRLTPHYYYGESWFGGTYFETQQEASFAVSVIEKKWEAFVRPYALNRTHDTGLTPLDGNELGLETRLTYRPGRLFKLLSLTVQGDHRETDAEFLGYDEIDPRLRARIGLPWRCNLDVIASYRWRRYNDINPAFGSRREDTRIGKKLRINRPILPWISVEASAEFTDNTSNFSGRDYQQQVYTAGMVVTF